VSHRWSGTSLKCHIAEVAHRWSGTSLKWHIVEVSHRWSVTSLKCHIAEVAHRWSGTSLKWHIVEVAHRWSGTSLKCHIVEVSHRWSVTSLKCHIVEVSHRWSVTSLKWHIVEVAHRWSVTSLKRHIVEVAHRWSGTSLKCHIVEVSHRWRQGPGNCLLLRTAYIVEYRWRASKIVDFILKFYPYFPKENKKGELWEGTRETWLDLLSKHTLVTEFHFDATLYSIFCNENSDADHVECSRGPHLVRRPQVHRPWFTHTETRAYTQPQFAHISKQSTRIALTLSSINYKMHVVPPASHSGNANSDKTG